MADMYGRAQQLSVNRGADGSGTQWRMLRDGAGITVPWYQALVFEGKVFGMHFGTVSTPIAGHAAIDADQPEAAVSVLAGAAVLPLSAVMSQETGGTSLAQGGMLVAVSNIDVGAGTSTAYTPFPMNFNAPAASSCRASHTYTGNGTDPLTAGNHLDLKRVSSVIDADAATSGIIPPTLSWSAVDGPAPLIALVGSFLAYAEAAANTVFGTLIWAEFAASDFT